MATKKPTQKPTPVIKPPKEVELEPSAENKKELTETPAAESLPEQSELKAELPKDYNEAHAINLDGDIREIKSTKLKYQRNNTAVAYRILQQFPLPDILSMDKGFLDPNRDGDQILFDFLVAVFDDPEYVKKHYDDMTSEDIDRILKIFCEVNKITEKEEQQAKNRQAKETRA